MMSNNEESEEFDNAPDLEEVAYAVAIETIVKMFRDLKSAGLMDAEAAAIVASLLKSESGNYFG